jgi:hypothetical protein
MNALEDGMPHLFSFADRIPRNHLYDVIKYLSCPCRVSRR